MYFFFQNPFTSQARQNDNYENAITYKILLTWNALSAEFTQQQQGTLK